VVILKNVEKLGKHFSTWSFYRRLPQEVNPSNIPYSDHPVHLSVPGFSPIY
jgi:hypothetical protein